MKITLEVEFKDHDKVILKNGHGDTYTSKSEELMDFLHEANKNFIKPVVMGRSEQLFCLCKEDAVIDQNGQCKMCGFYEKVETK